MDEEDQGPRKNFEDLMEDVVFVLSGFENPLRSELRDKAREMGASYSWNWTDECTHLMSVPPFQPTFISLNFFQLASRLNWNVPHVVCFLFLLNSSSAFKNTPKYKEVMGKGIIVKKEWIEDSYSKRRLLPWEK